MFRRVLVCGSIVLSELLPAARIRTPLVGRTKSALLRELVELAVPDVEPATVEGILSAVLAREAEISTAMGGGLAVPHGRTPLVSEVRMSAGLVHDVSDYAAPDEQPVQVAFLVLTPLEESGRHVKVLSRIARLMHGAGSRGALLASRTADEFASVIRQSEPA
jgi:mannitol/fructose-specific phosphotransferase system IIA component (Ntr-type)